MSFVWRVSLFQSVLHQRFHCTVMCTSAVSWTAIYLDNTSQLVLAIVKLGQAEVVVDSMALSQILHCASMLSRYIINELLTFFMTECSALIKTFTPFFTPSSPGAWRCSHNRSLSTEYVLLYHGIPLYIMLYYSSLLYINIVYFCILWYSSVYYGIFLVFLCMLWYIIVFFFILLYTIFILCGYYVE